MKLNKSLSLFLLVLFFHLAGNAQNGERHRVAIFAPLYLDSAFTPSMTYKYGSSMPKFINPGLEFYEGAQLALDSLSADGSPLEVFIYDTRSARQSISQQLDNAADEHVELIIAHCSSNEVRLFAEKALENKIPVINTTVPNDGGTSNNPYFVVLNPTLRTQCQGIYKFAQKNYPTKKIVVFRKKGTLEDAIKSYWDESAKTVEGTTLKFKYVDLPDSFTVNQLKAQLDTVSQTVCIAGSLDASFGDRLVKQLAALNLKKYRSVVIGMPTWETIKGWGKSEYKGLEIVYSTPFYNRKNDITSKRITHYFDKKLYQRPTDIVFRGFEVTYKYSKLLIQYGKDIASNLGSHQYTLFTDYDLQPVLSKEDMTLNYFENKQLYFLKWLDGVMRVVE